MNFQKTLGPLAVILIVFFLQVRIHEFASAEEPEDTRNNIKRQVDSIAEALESDRSRMTSRYGVIEGNVQRGTWSWASNSNGRTAERKAKTGCEKHGVGCDRLFSICIHNDTPYPIDIDIFHPWESTYDSNNALWHWNFSPGDKSNLAVNGNRLFISKRFFLKAKTSESGNTSWGPKIIGDYTTNLRNYKDGQNLLIRLTKSTR
jgi:hypothetical protein